MSWHNAHLILHGFIGIGSHKAIIPPAVVPVIVPHISVDTLLGLTIKAKYSKTELGPANIPLVARGNDSGYLVPHFSIPMNNVLLPLTIALGGSKVLFGSSKTLISVDGTAQQCGCCVFPVIPLSLNMACNDPCSYPGDVVIAPNTVEVGMTLGDIIMGIVSALIDVAVSFGMGKLCGGLSGTVSNAICRRVAQRQFFELAADFGVDSATIMCRDIAENLGERAVTVIASSLLSEVTKTGLESATDATLGAALGDGTNRGSLFDDAGNATANQVAAGPADNPGIYNTDGPGVRTGLI